MNLLGFKPTPSPFQPNPKAAEYEKTLERTLRLVLAVVNAVTHREHERLAGLLGQLTSIPPSKALLIETGVGHLLSDKSLWALGGDQVQAQALKLQGKWKSAVKDPHHDPPAPGRKLHTALHPFGGMKAVPFESAVAAMTMEVSWLLPAKLDPATVRQVAIAACLAGFRELRHFSGVTSEDIEVISRLPAAKAVMRDVVVAVEAREDRKRKRVREAATVTKTVRTSPLDQAPRPAASSSSTGSAEPAVMAEAGPFNQWPGESIPSFVWSRQAPCRRSAEDRCGQSS